MKVVSEELGAALATVSIKNRKELYLILRLFRAIGLDSWFLKVKHDRNPVLIVISNKAIVCIRSVRNHVWIQCLLRDLSFLHYGAIWELDHHLRLRFHLLLSHLIYWR